MVHFAYFYSFVVKFLWEFLFSKHIMYSINWAKKTFLQTINLPAGFNAPADPPVKPPSPLSAERLASCIDPNFPACSI